VEYIERGGNEGDKRDQVTKRNLKYSESVITWEIGNCASSCTSLGSCRCSIAKKNRKREFQVVGANDAVTKNETSGQMSKI